MTAQPQINPAKILKTAQALSRQPPRNDMAAFMATEYLIAARELGKPTVLRQKYRRENDFDTKIRNGWNFLSGTVTGIIGRGIRPLQNLMNGQRSLAPRVR